MAAGLTLSANLPPEKAATVTVLENESTPVMFNDPALMGSVSNTLIKTFGPDRVVEQPKLMGSEDVGVFGLNRKIPVAFLWLGAMEPTKFAKAQAVGKLLPGLHTSHFEPLPQPTIQTGVETMSTVATSLLQ
jgi:metal-dependent amidase/aminoacylase/carboxypeptidase family protein